MRISHILFFAVFFYLGCGFDKSSEASEKLLGSELVDTLASSEDNAEKLKSFFNKNGNIYKLEWSYLLSTRFEQKYDQSLAMEVEIPQFSDTLRALVGEQVRISGYYIPVDETGDENIVILSAYPYAQCFFCGQAGVESIIDILPSQPLPRLKTDDRVTFEGKFKLNKDDYDFLIYILEDAVLVQPED
jgi:hypothetical protein